MRKSALPSGPGINIQWPISTLILEGRKTIETRTYALPEKYIGKELFFIETPGKYGKFPARVVAIITFGESFMYKSIAEFDTEYSKHLVGEDSAWYWGEKPKWGWPILKLVRLTEPTNAPRNRGIVFTSSISI